MYIDQLTDIIAVTLRSIMQLPWKHFGRKLYCKRSILKFKGYDIQTLNVSISNVLLSNTEDLDNLNLKALRPKAAVGQSMIAVGYQLRSTQTCSDT